MPRLDKETNRIFYNEERSDERRRFAHEPSKMHTAELLVPWVAAALDPDDRLLDIAGGAGTYASEIARRTGARVVGLDISESMIEQRNEDPFLTENVVGDMEELPFDPESFDAAMFVAALHHVPDPLSALREAHRVLRPGASLFAFEPASLRALRFGVRPVEGEAHEFRISRRRLTERMTAAGFEVEHARGVRIAIRLLRPLIRRPSLRLFQVCDRVDRGLRLIPGLDQVGEVVMISARRT